MNKKISIIVPIYNSELWLSECIESLLNQTYQNIEIILINDGSSDRSREICNYFETIDSRVKVLHQENSGVSVARNNGLKISTGEYIQFVDSDDWIENDMCEKLINTIITHDADLVLCGLNIRKNNILLRTPSLPNRIVNIKESPEGYWFLRRLNLGPCNKLYKKSKIFELFDISKSLGEDSLFILNYMRNIDRIANIENCLYNVRLDNENSLNRKYRSNRIDLILDLRNQELNFYKDIYGENVDKINLYNEFILSLHACFREMVEFNNMKASIKIIKKYIKRNDISIASEKSLLERKDYRFFNFLIKKEHPFLIYIFLKLKIFLEKKGK